MVWDSLNSQSRVQQFCIMIVHDGVIVTIHEEYRWTIGRNMVLQR